MRICPPHRRFSRWGAPALLGFLVAFPLRLVNAAEPPGPRVVDHLRADADFIDDPFALSEDGSRIAWITTDAATHARVHMAPVGSTSDNKVARDFPYSSITPERIEFLDNERILVIDRNPETGMARGEIFSPAGSRDKLGPATDIALAVVGGTPAIVTYLKSSKPNSKTVTFTITAYRRDDMKLIGKKVMVQNDEGRVYLPGGPGKPLFFEDGYAVLVAQKEGAYDKKHDIRQPDVEGHFDLFGGKMVAQKVIKDLVAFAQLTQVRQKHENEANFVRFTDDLKRFELTDVDDVTTELQTPRPLRKYDPQTLATQPAEAGALYFSLTVDPVNAEAVKAQKADKDWLDIYHLDVKERKLVEIARIDGQKRPTTWRLAGTRLGVLRKHKGFGRGGENLEIFELGPNPALTSAARATAATKEAADAKGAKAPAGAEQKMPAAADPKAAAAASAKAPAAPGATAPASAAKGGGGGKDKAGEKAPGANAK